MLDRSTHDAASGAAPPAVVVYWRPGCPYCARLRWGLRRSKVASEWFNIWNDPNAAAYVRSVNGGDETVPTVVVGEITMLNPTPRQVKGELARQSSGLDAN